jgi:hypothetical protein
MNPMTAYVAAFHLQDLLDEAERSRRAKLAFSERPSVPAWRRSLGGLFVSAAKSVDPRVEVEYTTPLPNGRGVDPLPAC